MTKISRARSSWSWSYGSWIYNYIFNQCLSLMLWDRISIRTRCTTLCDKVCQWLATGRWFSPGPPVSSTNKTDRHDITVILLKVALNTINKQRSEYDKGRFWHNLRNCLYRYNIKHNHWKVRKIFVLMISLCPLLLSNVNGGGFN